MKNVLSKKVIGGLTVIEDARNFRVEMNREYYYVQKTDEFKRFIETDDEKAIETFVNQKIASQRPARKEMRKYKRNMKKFMAKNKANMKVINAVDAAKVNEAEGVEKANVAENLIKAIETSEPATN